MQAGFGGDVVGAIEASDFGLRRWTSREELLDAALAAEEDQYLFGIGREKTIWLLYQFVLVGDLDEANNLAHTEVFLRFKEKVYRDGKLQLLNARRQMEWCGLDLG